MLRCIHTLSVMKIQIIFQKRQNNTSYHFQKRAIGEKKARSGEGNGEGEMVRADRKEGDEEGEMATGRGRPEGATGRGRL